MDSNVICSGPPNLQGHSVLDIRLEELTCDLTSKTTPPPIVSTVSTTTTTQENDIIWSLAPSPTSRSNNNINNIKKANRGHGQGTEVKVKGQEINNMDSLIFGIVGGVIVLIVIFVVIIVCFVKLTSSSGSELVNPALAASYPQMAPSVVSVGHGGAKCTCPHKAEPHMHQQYATLRSNSKYHLSPQQQAAYFHQAAKYSTMSPGAMSMAGGGSIYAVHPSMQASGSASLSMYPTNNTQAMTMAQPSSLYNANPTYGGSYISPRMHQQQQQQQQQNSIYGSMPYYSHQDSEYDTRDIRRQANYN